MEGLTRAGTVPGRYEHTVTLMRLYHNSCLRARQVLESVTYWGHERPPAAVAARPR